MALGAWLCGFRTFSTNFLPNHRLSCVRVRTVFCLVSPKRVSTTSHPSLSIKTCSSEPLSRGRCPAGNQPDPLAVLWWVCEVVNTTSRGRPTPLSKARDDTPYRDGLARKVGDFYPWKSIKRCVLVRWWPKTHTVTIFHNAQKINRLVLIINSSLIL